MRIGDFEAEVGSVVEPILDDPSGIDPDLYESMDLLDKSVEVIEDLLTDPKVDMSIEQQLGLYKLKDLITEFTGQWDTSNQVETEEV